MSLTGLTYDVFVSYAHKDSADIAQFLERELRRAGLVTFKDTTDILVGEVVLEMLSEAIASSAYFIMLMSPGYFASGWCKQEAFEYLTSKLDRGIGAVLPILAVPCDVPKFIRPLKYLDLSRIELEDCCVKVLRRIQRDIGRTGTRWKPSKFPQWLDEACEIASLARRSATHILRNENKDWHKNQLEDLYYKICSIRTSGSSRLNYHWDELLEELQNSIHGFRDTEKDRQRIEQARKALRERGQKEFG